jgi:hypothetical protein
MGMPAASVASYPSTRCAKRTLGRSEQAVADLGTALKLRPGSDEPKAALKRLSAGAAR